MKQDRLHILVIEDNLSMREKMVLMLSAFWSVEGVTTLAEGRRALRNKPFDLLILDKHLPDGNGAELIPDLVSEFPDLAIVMLSRDDNLSEINAALAAGAAEYIIKGPSSQADLLIRIPMAIAKMRDKRKTALLEERLKLSFTDELIGRSRAISDLRLQIQQLKNTESPVLITGESGTGKELIAKRLWAVEGDSARPYSSTNCGAIPETLIESELFGYRKGAFTGANRNKRGLFELASGGDLFLDEVGELTLSAQVKLLTAIQNQEITPLGAEKPIKVSVRIIAATNRDLEQLVSEGKFREDLYYRLNVIRIETVPLADRLEDIEDLVRYFVLKKRGVAVTINPEVFRVLQAHPWSGNIRELYNWVERAIVKLKGRDGTSLETSDFQFSGKSARFVSAKPVPKLTLPGSAQDVTKAGFAEYMAQAERQYFEKALKFHRGRPYIVASAIGLSPSTVYARLKQLGIASENSGVLTARDRKSREEEGSAHV